MTDSKVEPTAVTGKWFEDNDLNYLSTEAHKKKLLYVKFREGHNSVKIYVKNYGPWKKASYSALK
jgi:hypothetical protein